MGRELGCRPSWDICCPVFWPATVHFLTFPLGWGLEGCSLLLPRWVTDHCSGCECLELCVGLWSCISVCVCCLVHPALLAALNKQHSECLDYQDRGAVWPVQEESKLLVEMCKNEFPDLFQLYAYTSTLKVVKVWNRVLQALMTGYPRPHLLQNDIHCFFFLFVFFTLPAIWYLPSPL